MVKSQKTHAKEVVLGDRMLREVWADQARLELPPHITPGPKRLGTTEQNMTADKRRSVATIHLVITLIRCWGNGPVRQKQMLVNFMHLITAMQIASMRNTSEELIRSYTFHYKKYLEGYVKLYKEAKVQPNHHLCLHLEIFLRLFGPVHSWRAWVFERFNYLLQNISTNSQFGKFYELCNEILLFYDS